MFYSLPESRLQSQAKETPQANEVHKNFAKSEHAAELMHKNATDPRHRFPRKGYPLNWFSIPLGFLCFPVYFFFFYQEKIKGHERVNQRLSRWGVPGTDISCPHPNQIYQRFGVVGLKQARSSRLCTRGATIGLSARPMKQRRSYAAWGGSHATGPWTKCLGKAEGSAVAGVRDAGGILGGLGREPLIELWFITFLNRHIDKATRGTRHHWGHGRGSAETKRWALCHREYQPY